MEDKKKVKDVGRVGKVQVRFWDEPNHYQLFRDECDKHDVSFQDVFLSLMNDFIEASQQGRVKVSE